jgi:hypothetical protein
MPFAGAILKYEADSPPSESSGSVPLLAWYVPSQDDANVYVFAGVERDAWRMHTGLLLPPGGALAKKPAWAEGGGGQGCDVTRHGSARSKAPATRRATHLVCAR